MRQCSPYVFKYNLQLRLPNAIALHSLSVTQELKVLPLDLCSCICSNTSTPLHLMEQSPLPQAFSLPWVKTHLSLSGGSVLWFTSLCSPLWGLRLCFWDRTRHMPQESTSAASFAGVLGTGNQRTPSSMDGKFLSCFSGVLSRS